jgi:hypothetical protein
MTKTILIAIALLFAGCASEVAPDPEPEAAECTDLHAECEKGPDPRCVCLCDGVQVDCETQN